MLKSRSLGAYLKLKKLEYAMHKAESYEDWADMALHHDSISGAEDWKKREDSDLFDARQIRKRLKVLRDNIELGDSEELLFALNEGIHGNMGGMGKSALYRQSRRGTKKLVNDYVSTVVNALRQVGDAPESEISLEDKLDFFRRASHCYGRSALTLSGGAGFIYFHHGVVDTLVQHKLLPHVISGASAGSWIAAQIGTRTDEELEGYFQNVRYQISGEDGVGRMFNLLRGVGRADVENERDDVIDELLGTTTFQEAYEHTGRYINIPIAPVERHQTSRLMNAITSPNVTIRSAVKASSTVPGVLEPAELEAKDSHGRLKPYLRSRRWVDGSFAQDLPFRRLSRLFGVNHYIVSMINPIAIPFLRPNRDAGPQGSLVDSFRTLSRVGAREYLKTTRRWISPFTLGAFDSLLGTLYRLVNQEYVGNINIMLDRSLMRTRYTWFGFEDDGEIQALISAGRRATWPRIDQIRNTAQVSQVIDEILEKLEHEVVAESRSTHLRHMVM